MKAPLLVCAMFALLAPLNAGKLPTLGYKPWYGTYAGYSMRYMDVALSTEGDVKVYVKNGKERLSETYAVELELAIYRRPEGSQKWTKRSVKKTGYSVAKAPHVQEQHSEIQGAVTGDVKFKLKLNCTKGRVVISGEFVGKPADLGAADYRMVLTAKVPDLYGITGSTKPRDISSKTRGDSISFMSPDRKLGTKKFRMAEKVDLKPYEKQGLKRIELRTKRYGKRTLAFLVDKTNHDGSLRLVTRLSERLYDGFTVEHVLVDEKHQNVGKGIVIEMR